MKVTSYLNLNFGDDVPFPERVDRAAEAGVDGIEVYGWDLGLGYGSPSFDLDAVAERIEDHGLEFVYLSGGRPDLTNPETNDDAIESIDRSLDLADEYDIRMVNVKAGTVQPDLERETQRQNVIRVLREAAPIAEASDTTLVLEPIPPVDHFLRRSAEGYTFLDAVDSPSVKLLLDIHHEQLVRGNLVNNLRENVAEYCAHLHVADPPPRGEPGTGEINWEAVFETVANTAYDGYMGGEFVSQAAPEEALSAIVALGERY